MGKRHIEIPVRYENHNLEIKCIDIYLTGGDINILEQEIANRIESRINKPVTLQLVFCLEKQKFMLLSPHVDEFLEVVNQVEHIFDDAKKKLVLPTWLEVHQYGKKI